MIAKIRSIQLQVLLTRPRAVAASMQTLEEFITQLEAEVQAQQAVESSARYEPGVQTNVFDLMTTLLQTQSRTLCLLTHVSRHLVLEAKRADERAAALEERMARLEARHGHAGAAADAPRDTGEWVMAD